MARYTVVTSFVVARDRLGEALAALPGLEQLDGDEAQSANEGEFELRVLAVREDPGDLNHPREQLLFSDVAWATTSLYRAGVPCRLSGWGCHEESE